MSYIIEMCSKLLEWLEFESFTNFKLLVFAFFHRLILHLAFILVFEPILLKLYLLFSFFFKVIDVTTVV